MARRVTLRELEHFVALAEHGSVTGAAAAIGLSQPAMSTSLRDLERTLVLHPAGGDGDHAPDGLMRR
jgi:hypothetical protein